MKVVIDRDKWARGKMDTALLLPPGGPNGGHMCCLGFLAIACGASYEDMLVNVSSPMHVPEIAWPEAIAPILDDGWWSNPTIVRSLMSVNDDEDIDEQQREQTLADMFRVAGVEVEFVGGD